MRGVTRIFLAISALATVGVGFADVKVRIAEPSAGMTSGDALLYTANAVDFGADKTGRRDSTDAIKAALEAVDKERGGTVFLPFFGIALSDDSGALARRCLGKTAQAVLLAGLEGQIREPLRDRMIIKLTGCSRASAFRALAELRSFGLVAPTARGLAIVPNAWEALRLAEPRLRTSPVRERLLTALYG